MIAILSPMDEDTSSLAQIEELGAYLLHTGVGDSWRGLSLRYTDDQQPQQQQLQPSAKQSAGASGAQNVQHVTSPPPCFSEMLLRGDGLGVGLGFESSPVSLAPNPDARSVHRATQDSTEPARESNSVLVTTDAGGKSTAPILPSPQCRPILNSDDDSDSSALSGSMNNVAGSNAGTPKADRRSFWKNTREKKRRQEVNVQFEDLVDVLGLSSRARKSAVLQEAVLAIKVLKRERDEFRRDRDHLRQQVITLSTCLQYTQLGSAVAASAVSKHHQLNQLPILSPSECYCGQQQQQQPHEWQAAGSADEM